MWRLASSSLFACENNAYHVAGLAFRDRPAGVKQIDAVGGKAAKTGCRFLRRDRAGERMGEASSAPITYKASNPAIQKMALLFFFALEGPGPLVL